MRHPPVITQFLIFLGLMLVAVSAPAASVSRHQVVDGVSVYLGVVPIGVAANDADDLGLDQKIYHKKDLYYLLIALIDDRSGRRIVDADIHASIAALGGLDYSSKQLKPVHIEHYTSYGNYFHLADPDTYRVQLLMTAPERSEPIRATFTYQRPAGG